MSHYLRYTIEKQSRSHSKWTFFFECFDRFDLSPFSKDDIDLYRPLVVLCLKEELEGSLKRFEHYQSVWFLCLCESFESSDPQLDRVFWFLKKDLSEFEFICRQLIDTCSSLWKIEIRERLKKDLKKINEDSHKALDVFFGEHKFNFKTSTSPDESRQRFDQLEKLFLKLRSMNEFQNLEDALVKVKFDPFVIKLSNCDAHDIIWESIESTLFLPLEGTSGYDVLIFITPGKIDLWDSLKASLIYQSLSRFEYILARRSDEHDDNSLWEQAVNVIEQPFALLSLAGDILVHNPAFAKLKISPKACSMFEDGHKIEENHKLYRVKRVDLREQHLDQVLLVFQSEEDPFDDNHRKLTTNELGIISGSLAHELNNPIAGILAAITVLELDDHWSEEDLKSLKDMKESAKRCQHLIEIFLGFTKMNPVKHDSREIKNSLNHALSLMRFRMIESALRIDLEQYEEIGCFEKAINSSVMSMIFYLILSDILTNYSQLRLLENEAAQMNNIHIYLRETAQDIQINMKYRWSLQTEYEIPKLLGHLLEIEGLILEVEGYSIRLLRFGLL